MLIYTKDETEYKLSDSHSTKVKNDIVTMFTSFYTDLTPSIAEYKVTKKHLYEFWKKKKQEKKNSDDNDEEFISSKVYEQFETYAAQLKNRCATNIETIFGAEGNTEKDHANSPVFKSFIEDKLEKMEYLSIYPEGIKDFIEKGGFYTFVKWEKEVKEVKRVVKFDIDTQTEATPESKNIIDKRITKTIVVKDDAKVIPLDPFSVVFDKNRIDDWDKCSKIVKTWMAPHDILAIENYTISDSIKDILEKIAKSDPDESPIADEEISQDALNGNMVEVLDFWGDYIAPDGKYLSNWHIVVVGRMEVVCFEKNPILINPITRCVFKIDPDTKREISPITVAVFLNKIKSDVYGKVLKGLDYALDPCHITNGKFGIKGEEKAKPGKIIELLNGTQDVQIIYSIDGKGLPINMEAMPMLDNDIESATGINKYLTGDTTGVKVDFATEASGIMGGSQVRINKEVDNINYNLTKVTIQKVSDLYANMTSEPTQIKVKENGNITFKEVTPDIIQGNYEFKIADANQMTLDKANVQRTMPILQQMATQDPSANVRAIEDYVLINYCGIKNPAQFFIDDPLQKMLKNMPEDMQEQTKQKIIQFLTNPDSLVPPQTPQPNKIVTDGFAKTICDDNRYNDEFKMAVLNFLNLQPTQEYLNKLNDKASKTNTSNSHTLV